MRLGLGLSLVTILLSPALAGVGDQPNEPTARIGVLVAGSDSDQAVDDAILSGVRMAAAEWDREHPDQSGSVQVVPIRANTRWDSQTSDIVRAIFDHRLAIVIGAPNRRTAHLAAQVVTRLKGSALLIAITEDETLTQAGVPWLMRMWVESSLAQASGARSAAPYEVLARDAGRAVLEAIAASGYGASGIREYLAGHRFSSRLGTFTFNQSGERVQ